MLDQFSIWIEEKSGLPRTTAKLAYLFLLAALPAPLLIGNGILPFLLGWFPTMIVHELGHSLFGWLAGVPSISFFFASFALAEQPVLPFLGLLWAVEICALVFLGRRKHRILQVLVGCCAASHLFFLCAPGYAVPCLTFGGMAGEFVLPTIFCVVLLECPELQSVKSLPLLFLSALAFWRSSLQWLRAALGWAPIPYPLDSAGGIALFQDPFTAGTDIPVGDLDKLMRTYGWTEHQVLVVYCSVAVLCLSLLTLSFILSARRPQKPGEVIEI